MKAIETIATVTADGFLTVQLPSEIPVGEYQLVLVIDEKPLTEKPVSDVLPAPPLQDGVGFSSLPS